MANVTSSLFSALSLAELSRLAARIFPGDALDKAALADGGMFNTTYFLTLKSGRAVVLRLGPVNRARLMPFEENLMAAESFAYDRFRACDVPTSRVLALDCSRTLLDRDYMVVERIPAQPLSALTLSPEDHARLYGDTGRMVRRIHDVTGTRFGRVSQLLSGGGYATWDQAMLGEISDWKQRAVPAALFTPDEFAQIDATFAAHRASLAEITVPRLIHADLWAGNVLIDQSGAQMEVAAIIDADRALYGDPDFEFASGWMADGDFFAGYGSTPAQSPAAILRRHLYALLYNLIDVYVQRCQFCNEAASLDNRRGARKHLDWLSQAK